MRRHRVPPASGTPVAVAGTRPTPAAVPAGAVPAGAVPAGAVPAGESAVDLAWAALTGVDDPELCLDVVSLGLVYGVRDEAGRLVVEMTLTTPGCPASEALVELARSAVEEAVSPGGSAPTVEVRLVFDPPWSPDRISEAAARRLGVHREAPAG